VAKELFKQQKTRMLHYEDEMSAFQQFISQGHGQMLSMAKISINYR